MPDTWRIVVLVDRDNDDCYELKQQLENISRNVGLTTKSTAQGGEYQIVNRLIIEELESWYFGDWEAVKAAYQNVSDLITSKKGPRTPDEIRGGTWETFERILRKAGYFKTGLRKIEAARSISQYLDPDKNRSRSFQVFRDTMKEIQSELSPRQLTLKEI